MPLLRERAAETDANRRSPDAFRALDDAGFFHILKPRRYGGLELSEHEHAKVAMTLARGCASTAWVFSILSSDNIAVLSYPEQMQEEIWGRTPTRRSRATRTSTRAKAVGSRAGTG